MTFSNYFPVFTNHKIVLFIIAFYVWPFTYNVVMRTSDVTTEIAKNKAFIDLISIENEFDYMA